VERKVVFAPEAKTDLLKLYDYIAERSGPVRAIAFINRIETHCLAFVIDVEGNRRAALVTDDAQSRPKVIPTCATLTGDAEIVTIDRIFYRGRDVARALRSDK
jgi:plasmid stabilization system protein ParE